MNKFLVLPALLASALIAAPAFAADKSATYQFAPQNNSGETGVATITPAGKGIEVLVKLTGAPADDTQPIHIHKGTCAKFDPKPTYMLSSVSKGESKTTLDIPASLFTQGDYVINVHKSVKEIATYVSCADLKPAK